MLGTIHRTIAGGYLLRCRGMHGRQQPRVRRVCDAEHHVGVLAWPWVGLELRSRANASAQRLGSPGGDLSWHHREDIQEWRAYPIVARGVVPPESQPAVLYWLQPGVRCLLLHRIY